MASAIMVLASPNAQVLPLLVLVAKQREWLNNIDIVVAEAPRTDSTAAFATAVSAVRADFGLFNVVNGARAHELGAKNLKLVACFLWGAPLIITREDIEEGDWAALSGSSGVIIAPAHAPLYRLGKAALRQAGLSDDTIELRSHSNIDVINMMRDKSVAPSFAIVPEPEATEILTRQRKEAWPVHYRRFADVTKTVNPNGLPLGGLWKMNGTEKAPAFLEAFAEAVSYLNDPQTRGTASQIISEGYQRYFPGSIDLDTDGISEMLSRGNIDFRYSTCNNIHDQLMALWQQFELFPTADVLYP